MGAVVFHKHIFFVNVLDESNMTCALTKRGLMLLCYELNQPGHHIIVHVESLKEAKKYWLRWALVDIVSCPEWLILVDVLNTLFIKIGSCIYYQTT